MCAEVRPRPLGPWHSEEDDVVEPWLYVVHDAGDVQENPLTVGVTTNTIPRWKQQTLQSHARILRASFLKAWASMALKREPSTLLCQLILLTGSFCVRKFFSISREMAGPLSSVPFRTLYPSTNICHVRTLLLLLSLPLPGPVAY